MMCQRRRIFALPHEPQVDWSGVTDFLRGGQARAEEERAVRGASQAIRGQGSLMETNEHKVVSFSLGGQRLEN